jgi:hypothetical protein
MWISWVALMAFIVFTSRYGKKYWRNSVFIHACFGTVIFVLTLVGGIMAWVRIGGMAFDKWTSLLENIAIYLSWGLCIGGMIAYYFRRFGKYEWNTKLALKLVEAHRWFGRIYVFGLQGLIIFAIIDNFGFSPTWFVVAFAQFFGLVLVFAILEIRH